MAPTPIRLSISARFHGSVRLGAVALYLVIRSTALFSQTFPEIANISVGRSPAHAALSPHADWVYITNLADGTVSVIDTASLSLKFTIRNVGVHPDAIVVAPDNSVYVAESSVASVAKPGIYVIDGKKNQLLHFVSLEGSVLPNGSISDIAITPDGKKLYVAIVHSGLGVITTADLSFHFIEQDWKCPEALAISGSALYVNYQCSVKKFWGHDPIRVFDTSTDMPVARINFLKDGKKIANVGGALTVSPKGDLIWANGNDACSRQKTKKDPLGYDFEGCQTPMAGESVLGRGIMNVISTKTNVVEFGLCFVGTLAGGLPQGAALPSFFPDGSKVAVSTETRLLFFDAYSATQIGNPIDNLPSPGNVVFAKGMGFLPLREADTVRVFRFESPAPQYEPNWYTKLWRDSFRATLSAHITLLMVLWAIASVRFARQFSNISLLRLPLNLDVYIRKQRSTLIKMYLDQLRVDTTRRMEGVQIVELPMKTGESRSTTEWQKTTTDRWINEFVKRAGLPKANRVSLEGRGGSGKSLLVRQVILALIKSGFVPMFIEAATYNEDQDTRGKWITRVLQNARVPLSSETLESLPNIVYLIDQISEIPIAAQAAFSRMMSDQFALSAGNIKLLACGRVLTGSMGELQWEEVVTAEKLEDTDILKIASTYLDRDGTSTQVREVPDKIRRDIMKEPTPFVVAHYSRILRDSSRPVVDQRDLFREILDSHVKGGQLSMSPSVVKRILETLVTQNFGIKKDRGFPIQERLVDQVHEIIFNEKLREKYGEANVPEPAIIVEKLVASGLLYRLENRHMFFHDAFEDWLLEEAKHATEGAHA